MIGKKTVFLASIPFVVINIVLLNTFFFTAKKIRFKPVEVSSLSQSSIENFQSALQFKTISYYDTSRLDSSAFFGLHRFFRRAYPLTHLYLRREVVNRYSLLFTWSGKDPSLKPIILLAHMDVVPVEKETLSQWEFDPFQGKMVNGFIHGRGTVDNKLSVIAIFESIENLLRKGYEPERTIYLAFGHDEEIGGTHGAKHIATILKNRNVQADLVLDEGGFVTSKKFPSLKQPLALLGTSEKGYLNLKLSLQMDGGHSSMPEKETAISVLSKSIANLQDLDFPGTLTPSAKDFIARVGPSLPFGQKLVFANQFLFKRLILYTFSKTPAGHAMTHTIATPTIINGGMKENVVPAQASAVINIRLLPGDTPEYAIKEIKKIIDPRIAVEKLRSAEISEFTSMDSYGYKLTEKTVGSVFSGALVSPFLLIGGTDSRHFTGMTESTIRFTPMMEAEGFHGINERISLESFRLAIAFYQQLIINSYSDAR